jgi:hypothetical protein
MAFQCAACGHDLEIAVMLPPETVVRCSSCEKIFGRTDAVVTDMVDLASDVSTEMLRLALNKLFNAS